MQPVSARDAKARFGALLDTARREPVVIERHGWAVAVVRSKEEYDALNDIKRSVRRYAGEPLRLAPRQALAVETAAGNRRGAL